MIFDFDGVILDSVSIKTDAMRQLFASERPEDIEAILALHLRLGGVSRFRKFELIYSDILQRPLSAEISAELGRRFEVLAFEAIVRCPEIPGARAFLQDYAEKIPLFVISGTPEEELWRIARARSVDGYFVEMHGSPRGKTEILTDLLRRHAFRPACCVFVGDATTDFEAAQDCAMPFVGVVAPGTISPFARSVPVVPDLTSLTFALERLSSAPMAIKGTA
jgi:phosphoglycolate phosphatase